jgi:hypothetical protein
MGSQGLASALLLSMSIAGSACVGCARQCSAPYELDVAFRSGTTSEAASAVLADCGRDQVVTKIESPYLEGQVLMARMWTHYYRGDTRGRPLLS